MARSVVAAGLVLQFVLTILQILQSYPAETWIARLRAGHTEPILGTAVLALLLALVVPAARGRRWALALSVVLQALLTYEMLPWLVRKFSRPEDYAQWILNLGYCVVGATATVFGVLALLETLGRARPSPWSRAGEPTRPAWILLLILSGVTGAAVAGAGAARRPLVTATFPGVPDQTATVSLDLMSFTPTRLELPAGKKVALLLTNRATDEHSFDLDAQNIHVVVPAGSTALAMVQVPDSGELPFYCGVPGHTEAGMTGVIVAR